MIPNFKVGDWLVEPSTNRISKDQDVREVEPRHMRVLVCLLSHPGKQVAISKLLQEAYRNKRASEDSLHIAIRHLREALDDTGERPRYIQTVAGKGYTLIAKTKPLGATETSDRPRGLSWKLVLAAVVVAMIVFMLQRQKTALESKKVEAPITSVMMKPLASIPNSEATARLTQVVSDAMHNRLASLNGLRVISPPEPAQNSQDHSLGEVDVDAVVEGSLSISEPKTDASGNKTRNIVLKAQLTRRRPHHVLWSKRIDGTMEQLMEMQARLSDELSTFLSATPYHTAGDNASIKPEAYQAFAEGHALLTKQQYAEAADQFETAIRLEPKFAEPFLGLALAKTKLAQTDPLMLHKELAHLIELLKKAIELKPDLAEAYSALGTLQFLYSWEFAEAEKNLRKALEINPNDVEPHHWYAMFSLAFGRFDTTREHLEIVHRLAPYSYSATEVAWMYNMMGDYESAERELDALAKREPNSFALHSARIRLYENWNKEDRAFKEYLTVFRARGYNEQEIAEVNEAYKRGRLPGISHWLAYTKFEQHDVGQYDPPLSFARYLAAINEKRLALDWLIKAAQVKQPQLLWLNVDPKYDALKSDPNFGALITQIGLDYRSSDDDQSP